MTRRSVPPARTTAPAARVRDATLAGIAGVHEIEVNVVYAVARKPAASDSRILVAAEAHVNVGRVVQVIGPTVDVAFDPEQAAEDLQRHPDRGQRTRHPASRVEVALHVGDNVVRCIAMD